ncbi:MAG: tRNA-dihydrouridine synthase family protein [Lachnospiraceae bacterium]|nr:tRNA-dihydrouridine synthase family protein [Lachnospiraceae bacterium]
MKIYMAPMEGPTGFVFRRTYNKYFGGIDRYFTPFVTGLNLGAKEKKDICPENNPGMDVATQILTRQVDEFLSVANYIHKEYGYERININLGCPSGTVVARKRGSGFLLVPEELDNFLYEIFEKSPIKISIKTRIGVESEDEWERLLEIYEKYPLDELIIHPRLRTDFYKNDIHHECFKKAYESSKHSLCYNGDINTVEDFIEIKKRYPNINAIMIGRGLLRNPFLVEEIRQVMENDILHGKENVIKKSGKNRESCDVKTEVHLTGNERLRAFLKELENGYLDSMPDGEKNTLAKMKELWVYLGEVRPEHKKALKEVKKAKDLDEYHAAISSILI